MSSLARRSELGQSLVESSLALAIFLMLLIGTVDLGRLAYQYNAVGQAARELARVASVHPGTPLGSSPETTAALASQQAIVPGLGSPAYVCVDVANVPVEGTCSPREWVRVTISSRFDPILPVLAALGPIDLTTSGSAAIE